MSSSVSSSRLNFEEIDLDRFDDAPFGDRSTDLSVSVLAGIGVIRGNDDGTFAASRRLNRAEFVQIIMRLFPNSAPANTNCFPDVNPSDWFADPVCRAKASGLVRGNAREGISEDMWRFEPAREVQYEEAVKILVTLYALPIVGDTEGEDWYVPYINAAADLDLDISGLQAGDRITRGEMARLTAAFVAHAEGRLEAFRDAENATSSRSSSSSRMSSISRSSIRPPSSSSSFSANGTGIFDPLDDTAVRSSILVLGKTSPILAGVQFFSNNEPVDVTEITVNLEDAADSIASLVVYNASGEQLGIATAAGSSQTFTARIPSGRLQLPYRQNHTIYVRARMKDDDGGGVSGEAVQVDNITLSGEGAWSNEEYSTTSTDTFQISTTALGSVLTVAASGVADGVIANGTQTQLAEFRFTADPPPDEHDVRITTLRFTIEQGGGVTVTNPYITVEGSGVQHNCSVSSSIITCSSIPASIGTVDTTRTIRVFGDVTVPSGAGNRSLRIVLSNPGSPSEAGDITWTDGVTTFTWLPLSQPMARGTQFD
jgi:hypothetical protein